MLQVNDLMFSYGETPLYEGVSFTVGKGQKVGLVGPNGSGKSTLLKILTGKEEDYIGKVSLDEKFAIVPQEIKNDPIMDQSSSVRSYVDPESLHGDHEIEKLFDGLQLSIDLDINPKVLSGGQKTKISLARALLSKPEIIFLDEPTNFMDLAGKRFVMNFLADYEGTVVVISHDLELMNHAIDKILSVNPATKTIEEYKGNYTDYLRLKAEKEALAKRQFLIKQKHIAQMEKGLRKLTRSTKAKVKQRKRIEKERENLPELPPEVRAVKVRIPEPANVGELPIKILNVSKSYGTKQVLKDISFTLLRGERLSLIGPNGTGKSTLIKILMGKLSQDSGEIIKNENLKVGYYSQEFESFDFQKTVLDTFTEATKHDSGFSRAFLGRYMFMGNKVFQKVETLSGGEKTRLSIAILTAKDNNLLILDEPTTYLDVISQRVILESLKEYKGAMILVSHTPDFIRELLPKKVLLFPEERLTLWDESFLDRVVET